MKQSAFILSIAFSLVCTLVFSQNSAVTNAILYHKDGDIAKAKEEIDKACLNDKTSGSAKTWYNKGNIYKDIAKSEKPEIKSLSANALKESYDAYMKAKELDPGKGEFYKLSDQGLEEIWSMYINNGAQQYENSQYKQALNSFEYAQTIKPADSSAYIYACYTAEELKDLNLLKRYADKLSETGYKSPYLYKCLMTVANDLEKNPEKAIGVSEKALTDFPMSRELLQEQTNLYISTKKTDKAIQNLQKMLMFKPGDALILSMLGVQYTNKADNEKALEYYEKALKSEPDNFVSNYNSAVIYFEKGKAENEKIHKLSVDEYHKQGKDLEDKVNEHFAKAKAHAEKALAGADGKDAENIKLMISEIGKVMKNETQQESIHK